MPLCSVDPSEPRLACHEQADSLAAYGGERPANLETLFAIVKGSLPNINSASYGVRTHAQLPALDLKSNPLTTLANLH